MKEAVKEFILRSVLSQKVGYKENRWLKSSINNSESLLKTLLRQKESLLNTIEELEETIYNKKEALRFITSGEADDLLKSVKKLNRRKS